MDNARRSGPVPVTFRPAIGAPGARRRPGQLVRCARPTARDGGGACCGGVRGSGAVGQRPAPVRFRAGGSGPGCPPPAARPPAPWPLAPRTPRLVQRFSVYVLRALREHGQGWSAWRAEGAPLMIVKIILTGMPAVPRRPRR
jgi:hypothetical protein